MTFILLTSQVVQRARPLRANIVVVGSVFCLFFQEHCNRITGVIGVSKVNFLLPLLLRSLLLFLKVVVLLLEQSKDIKITYFLFSIVARGLFS